MSDEDYDEDYDVEDDDEDFVDNTIKKKHIPKKVEISIRTKYEDGSECRYGPHVDGHPGELYTSVGFNASTYGATGGCTTEAEIQESIKHYKESITKAGDIPIVKDYREIVEEKVTKLDAWFGGTNGTA